MGWGWCPGSGEAALQSPCACREAGDRHTPSKAASDTHHAFGSSRVGAGHGATRLHAGALREGEWKGRRRRGATPGQRMLEPSGRA